jgi:hypothetical protein
LLTGCGAAPAPTAGHAPEAQMEARLGKVTFTAVLDKDGHFGGGAKSLPYPFLRITATPKLGEPVIDYYFELFVGDKRIGQRYLFPGTDGQLYAVVDIDEASSKHIAYPSGTAYWRVGSFQAPASMAQGEAIAFTLPAGAHLERHSEFAFIRTDTWISLHLDSAPVVQSPPLVKANTVK